MWQKLRNRSTRGGRKVRIATKGRVPEIRYFVANSCFVAIYAFVEISTKGRKASCFCRDEAFRQDLNERLHAFVLFLTDWLTEPPLYLIAWQKFCHSTHHFFDSRPGSTFVLVTFHNFADLADLLRQALYITKINLFIIDWSTYRRWRLKTKEGLAGDYLYI